VRRDATPLRRRTSSSRGMLTQVLGETLGRLPQHSDRGGGVLVARRPEGDRADICDRVGQPRPEFGSRGGELEHPLPSIVYSRGLLDQAFAHERRNDDAQGRTLELQHLPEVALHRRAAVRELVQHVPLRRPEPERPQGRFERLAVGEVVPLRPGSDALMPDLIAAHLTS